MHTPLVFCVKIHWGVHFAIKQKIYLLAASDYVLILIFQLLMMQSGFSR